MASLDSRGIVTQCAACGQPNRLAYASLGRESRCGRCGAALAHPDEPIAVGTAAEFDALIATSSLPVLVDYWAAWCGPCRMVAPEVATVARELQGSLIVLKVDTEALPDLAARARIQSIPALAVFDHGREAGRLVGARPAREIMELVKSSAGVRR